MKKPLLHSVTNK